MNRWSLKSFQGDETMTQKDICDKLRTLAMTEANVLGTTE